MAGNSLLTGRDRNGGSVRQEDAEGSAALFILFSPDAASVLADDGPADGEAETGSALLAGIGGIHLLESVKDTLQFIRRDAAALIDDAQDNAIAALGNDNPDGGLGRGEF